jgi:predicted dehydrogenase
MNMNTKLRIAFIGAGEFSRTVHLPVLSSLKGVEISGICDLNIALADTVAKEFKIPKIFNDHRKMLADIQVDAVYVILPPHILFDPVMDCLETGHNVFIEKPPAITTMQIQSLAKVAVAKNCITMTGFQRRHIPLLTFLRNKVEEKGGISQFTVNYYKNEPHNGSYYRGAIDILRCDMIHAVDMLRHLGGEVTELTSYISGIDDDRANSCNVMAKFDTGRIGIMQSTWEAGRRFFTIEIHGNGVSVFIDPDSHGMLYSSEYPDGKRYTCGELAGSDEYLEKTGFLQESCHFLDCIREKRQPVTNFSECIKTMKLVDRLQSY